MKKTFIPILVAAAMLTTVSTANVWAAGANRNTNQPVVGQQQLANQGRQGWLRAGGNQFNDGTCSILSTVPAQADPLTATQAEDLALMWREEKLARDVYSKLAETWNLRSFTNIVTSEQQHMDTLKALLDRYGVAVPVDATAVGQYANSDLQALYGQLVAQGMQSTAEALKVGVAIEQADIKDLDSRTNQASADVAAVFAQLKQASVNHLAAFNRNLGTEQIAQASPSTQGQGRQANRGMGLGAQIGRGANRMAGQ